MPVVYHFTSTLDSTFEIKTIHDMARVEKRMSDLVSGDKGRCCILNSESYNRLRLAALYDRERYTCMRIRHNNITMELMGNTVRIYLEHGVKTEEILAEDEEPLPRDWAEPSQKKLKQCSM